MCSSCGSKTYGQAQPEARAKDVEKLKKQRERTARKVEASNN